MSLVGKALSFDNILPQEDYTVIRDYVQSLSFNDKSPVFKISTGEHIVAEDIRSSHSLVIEDQAVLSLVRKSIIDQAETSVTLPGLPTADELLIQLARDHVTFIKYEKGGFFGWHQDFEKYILNGRKKWIECHLIYCIEAPEEGGQLEIKMTPDNIPISFPLSNNSCIIFDKSLEHCACPVLEGRKIIMTADVLVSTKYVQDHSLDMEMVEYVATQKSFLSYDIDILKRQFSDATAFLVLEIRPESKYGRTCIFDSKGLYYMGEQSNDTGTEDDSTDWRRGSEETPPLELDEGIIDFDHIDIAPLLDGELMELIRSDLQNANLTGYEPLPDDVDIKELLLLPRLHKLESSKKIQYTYHCNEPNYDSVSINELVGIYYTAS